jgi:PAS domain S-box-containing protein
MGDQNLIENNQSEYVLQLIPYGVLLEDCNRKLLSVNNEFLHIFNITESPAELIGLDCELLTEDSKKYFADEDQFSAFITDCIANKRRNRTNFELINNRFVELTYIPYFKDNVFSGHNWCYNNITERIENKIESNNKDSFYNNIINFIPAEIAVFNVYHQYLFLNKTAIKDDALREWMIGKTDYDYCEFSGINHDIAVFRQQQFKVVTETKKIHFWEDQKLNKEGEVQTILRVLNPYLNSENDIEFIVGYGLDISETKNKDKEIIIEAKKNKRLLDNLNEVVFETDESGTITNLNNAWIKLSGNKIESIIGKSILSLIDDKNEKTKLNNFIVDENQHEISLKFIIQKTANQKWVEGYLAKVYDKNNNLTAFWGTIIDITEREKYNNTLLEHVKKEKELNELKTRFVHMVSHEVRTPMAGILSSIELLEIMNVNIPNQLKENNYKHFDRIKSQISRISDLMNNVLLLGKIESGKVEISIQQVDIIDKIADLLQENFNFKNNKKIEFNYTGEPYFIGVDWKLIYHVMINLISNAYKYSKSDNPIEIHLTFEDTQLKIAVKDYGIGIPESEITQLFNPFNRASNVGNISGTGLGLILVKNLIELHDGKIEVISKENIGSTFLLTLPKK